MKQGQILTFEGCSAGRNCLLSVAERESILDISARIDDGGRSVREDPHFTLPVLRAETDGGDSLIPPGTEHKGMVVSLIPSQLNVLRIFRFLLFKRMEEAEIKGRMLYAVERFLDEIFPVFSVPVRIDPHFFIEYRFRIIPGQIEINVTGKIEPGIPVTHGLILYSQDVIFRERVEGLYLPPSGKTVQPVRKTDLKDASRGLILLDRRLFQIPSDK